MTDDILQADAIMAKIRQQKAKWTAARTPLSTKSPEERKKYLGLKPKEEELSTVMKLGLHTEMTSRFFTQQMKLPPRAAGVPSSKDWRDVDGTNWMTSIKDQGGCGSCVAHGTLAALEALLKIRFYKDANKEIELCRAHLLWCGGGDCGGWHMDGACDYLKANGVPDEQCLPYRPESMQCSDTCPDWKDRVDHTQLRDWTHTTDVQQMKANLAENGPQITGIAVYDDFYSYVSGVYRHVTGDLSGYHCIAAVGFNDDDGCWICKNSWGDGFGEGGYFRIGYGECGLEDVFGMWNMQVQEPSE